MTKAQTTELKPGDLVSVKWHESSAKIVSVDEEREQALVRWPCATVSVIGTWRLEKIA
jgi:hypothetical protein